MLTMLRAGPTHRGACLFAVLVSCGCGTTPPGDGASDRATSPAESWTSQPPRGALPALRAVPIPPLEPGHFEQQFGLYEYRQLDVPPGEPYPSNEEACAAATQWIEREFGSLPAEHSLVAREIDPSASGSPVAFADQDRGHTIVFDLCFRGVPTDQPVIVYLRGRTVESATLQLVRLEPVAGSEQHPCTPAEAAARVVELMHRSGAAPDITVEEVAPEMRLRYTQALHTRSRDGAEVLTPCWGLGYGPSMYFDPRTGEIWRNG